MFRQESAQYYKGPPERKKAFDDMLTLGTISCPNNKAPNAFKKHWGPILSGKESNVFGVL